MLVDTNEYKGAAVIDEVSEILQYIGYATSGAPAESSSNWAIKRVQKTGTVIRIMWADGLQDKIYKWSDRAALSYTYKK